jgi:hypothetical protein
MTQHTGEALALDGVVGILTVRLQERHPSLNLRWQPTEPFLSLVQHRARRI